MYGPRSPQPQLLPGEDQVRVAGADPDGVQPPQAPDLERDPRDARPPGDQALGDHPERLPRLDDVRATATSHSSTSVSRPTALLRSLPTALVRDLHREGEGTPRGGV